MCSSLVSCSLFAIVVLCCTQHAVLHLKLILNVDEPDAFQGLFKLGFLHLREIGCPNLAFFFNDLPSLPDITISHDKLALSSARCLLFVIFFGSPLHWQKAKGCQNGRKPRSALHAFYDSPLLVHQVNIFWLSVLGRQRFVFIVDEESHSNCNLLLRMKCMPLLQRPKIRQSDQASQGPTSSAHFVSTSSQPSLPASNQIPVPKPGAFTWRLEDAPIVRKPKVPKKKRSYCPDFIPKRR